MIIRLIALLPLVLSAQNVLMIGNSYSNQPAPYLRAMLSAATDGSTYTLQEITPDSVTTLQHSQNEATMTTIAEDEYDHVIIQEQSRTHAFARNILISNHALTAEQNFFKVFHEVNKNNTQSMIWPSSVTYWGSSALIEAIKAGQSADAQIHAYHCLLYTSDAADD